MGHRLEFAVLAFEGGLRVDSEGLGYALKVGVGSEVLIRQLNPHAGTPRARPGGVSIFGLRIRGLEGVVGFANALIVVEAVFGQFDKPTQFLSF